MTSITIAHFGDVHLGGKYPSDELRTLKAYTDSLLAKRPDVVFIGGDVLHSVRRRAPVWIRNAFRDMILALVNAGMDVVFLRGNHDLYNDLRHFDDIRAAEARCYYFNEPGIYQRQIRGVDVNLFCMPYPDTRWAIQDVASIAPGDRLAAIEDGMRDVIDGWHETLDQFPDGANAVGYHGDMEGSLIDISNELISKDPKLAPCDFVGFGVVMANHIHFPHSLPGDDIDDPTLWYSGGAWPMVFGEKGQGARGYLLHTFSPHTKQWTAEQVSLAHAYRKLITHELSWDDSQSCLVWADGTPWAGLPQSGSLRGVTSPQFLAQSRVRVVVRYPKSAFAEIDQEAITREFRQAGAHDARIDRRPIGETRIDAGAFQPGKHSLEQDFQTMWDALGGRPENPEELAWFSDALVTLEQEETGA